MVRVDQLCSQHKIKVFCGDVYGYYGYMFCNLGQEYSYVEWVGGLFADAVYARYAASPDLKADVLEVQNTNADS